MCLMTSLAFIVRALGWAVLFFVAYLPTLYGLVPLPYGGAAALIAGLVFAGGASFLTTHAIERQASTLAIG